MKYDEFVQELRAVATIARKYLRADAPAVLEDFARRVGAAAAGGQGQSQQLGITTQRPVVTLASTAYKHGAVEPIYGELSSTWIVEPYDHDRGPRRRFAINDIASTRVRLLRATDDAEIAMWRMEIQSPTGPGLHFHTQIRGSTDDVPFPQWARVPRLPGIPATPPLVLEYLLGELFQDEWHRHIQQQRLPNHAMWRKLQRRRYLSLLDWQREHVDGGVSALTALKFAKPEPDLLCREV